MHSEEKNHEEVTETVENSHQSEEHVSEKETESESGEQCHSELLLWKDQCKRISAEFENFRKRTEREQVRWKESAQEDIILELLSFVDTFDRALQQTENSDQSGLKMVYNSLTKLLEKYGVKKLDEYGEFNPEIHEAIMQVDSPDHESGHIVEVFSQGFMLKDRVLRPAKVSVAK